MNTLDIDFATLQLFIKAMPFEYLTKRHINVLIETSK